MNLHSSSLQDMDSQQDFVWAGLEAGARVGVWGGWWVGSKTTFSGCFVWRIAVLGLSNKHFRSRSASDREVDCYCSKPATLEVRDLSWVGRARRYGRYDDGWLRAQWKCISIACLGCLGHSVTDKTR
jgi:hypothetical protein